MGTHSVLVHNKCGFNEDQTALIKIAKKANKTGVSKEEANILWSWTKEVGLSDLRSFHEPKFDSYLGGSRLHMKINEMHINIY